MKTLQINKIIEETDRLNLKIDPDFFKLKQIDAPILKQVDLLLNAVGDEGLKLTVKGNLPTRVVKEIAQCCPALSEKVYLGHTKRFLEEEQVSVMRARAVCQAGKLLKVSKGKMHLGSMAQAYMNASEADRYLYLVWQFGQVNLAYFDRMQESPLVWSLSFLLMQMVRDNVKMFREVSVYCALLIDGLPAVADRVEAEISPDLYFSKNPFDEFETLVKRRNFKNFFVPFGLVEEKGVRFDEVYECCKTDLLQSFLLPVNEIKTSVILNKKQFHAFTQRIKKEKLDINLFDDFCFIYVNFGRYPLEPIRLVVKNLIDTKRLVGTAVSLYEAFYTDFAHAAEQTILYFTRLEVKGGGERGDEMQNEFISFVDGLFMLLPKEKPYALMGSMHEAVFFLLDMLVKVYGIDTTSPDFHAECQKHFDDECTEDIGIALFMMDELVKKTKKSKRITAALEEMTKETLITFVLAVMSMHTSNR